MIHAIAQYHRT